MDAGFCVDCLEEAIKNYGSPKIFNTDQGSQFTSDSFTGLLIQQSITLKYGQAGGVR
jgi:putative transposase